MNINLILLNFLLYLVLAIYGYWFKDNKHKIKIIKGPLESFIRQAYFGGNSQIFVQGYGWEVISPWRYNF